MRTPGSWLSVLVPALCAHVTAIDIPLTTANAPRTLNSSYSGPAYPLNTTRPLLPVNSTGSTLPYSSNVTHPQPAANSTASGLSYPSGATRPQLAFNSTASELPSPSNFTRPQPAVNTTDPASPPFFHAWPLPSNASSAASVPLKNESVAQNASLNCPEAFSTYGYSHANLPLTGSGISYASACKSQSDRWSSASLSWMIGLASTVTYNPVMRVNDAPPPAPTYDHDCGDGFVWAKGTPTVSEFTERTYPFTVGYLPETSARCEGASFPVSPPNCSPTGDASVTSIMASNKSISGQLHSLDPKARWTQSSCTINGNTVKLFYWPTKVSRDLACPTKAVTVVTPEAQSSQTAVIFGTTVTSPSVYISVDQLYLYGPVPETTSVPWPLTTDVRFVVPESSVSSLISYLPDKPWQDILSTFIQSPFALTSISVTPEPYNFANLDGPVSARDYYMAMQDVQLLFREPYRLHTIYDDYRPLLSIPDIMRSAHPLLRHCSIGLQGIYDPPSALTHGSTVDAPVMTSGVVTTAFDGKPTPAPPASPSHPLPVQTAFGAPAPTATQTDSATGGRHPEAPHPQPGKDHSTGPERPSAGGSHPSNSGSDQLLGAGKEFPGPPLPGQPPAAGQSPPVGRPAIAGQPPAGQPVVIGQPPTGQPPAGQLPAGQPPANPSPSGQTPPLQLLPGQLPPGQPPPGQALPGKPLPGQLMPGQLPPGQPPPGQLPPGQPLPGQPLPGQPLPGQSLPGQPLPGQPLPGQPLPGQPLPGQPLPGQPLPGQPLPGQPLPGQPPATQLPAGQGPSPKIGQSPANMRGYSETIQGQPHRSSPTQTGPANAEDQAAQSGHSAALVVNGQTIQLGESRYFTGPQSGFSPESFAVNGAPAYMAHPEMSGQTSPDRHLIQYRADGLIMIDGSSTVKPAELRQGTISMSGAGWAAKITDIAQAGVIDSSAARPSDAHETPPTSGKEDQPSTSLSMPYVSEDRSSPGSGMPLPTKSRSGSSSAAPKTRWTFPVMLLGTLLARLL